jgi:hypothetical protein
MIHVMASIVIKPEHKAAARTAAVDQVTVLPRAVLAFAKIG